MGSALSPSPERRSNLDLHGRAGPMIRESFHALFSLVASTGQPVPLFPRHRPRSSPFRPQLEGLEDRLTPAVHTWTGVGDNLWSNDTNWIGASPHSNESNVKLIFPAGASHLSNMNDLPGLAVQSLAFSDMGYVLDGMPITLGAGGITDFCCTRAPTSFALDLVLSGGTRSFLVNHQGVSLFLDGVLTGAGGFHQDGCRRSGPPQPQQLHRCHDSGPPLPDHHGWRGPGFECRRDDRAEGSDPCSARGISVTEPLTAHGCRRGSLRRLDQLRQQQRLDRGSITLQTTPTTSSATIDVEGGFLQLKSAIGATPA